MENSKLISLLNTFDKIEWRSFSEFLASPYFNKNKSVIKLYRYLKNQYPDFRKEKLDKELVFSKLFPKEKFNPKTYEDLVYHFLRLAENFLLHNHLNQNPIRSNLILLEELVERKLDKHYRTYQKKIAKLIESEDELQVYDYKYQLATIERKHFLAPNPRKYNPILHTTIEDLDQFYFLNKLQLTCNLLDWKNILSVDVNINFIEPIITNLEAKSGNLPPLIEIYLAIYNLQTKAGTDEQFIKLKLLLKKHQQTISNQEKAQLYLSAINYCTFQMQKNNNVYFYVEQCLELYLEGIQQKFLYDNGYLTPWTFKNVVKLGFNLKKYDWTSEFIQEYHKHLEETYQEDALHYNMADLHYRNKEYGAAQTHLIQVQYSDIFYVLGTKAMLLKIYFETEEEEALLSMIASFSIYLKRNKKIANNFKQTYLNFTNYLYKIIRAKPDKLPQLIADIKQVQPIANRRWLLSNAEKQMNAQKKFND